MSRYTRGVWRGLVVLAGCGRIDFDSLPIIAGDGALLTYRDAVLADHPVAYWRLDDGDTTARDSAGSIPGTYNGTCMRGVAGALVGDPDTATHFDGGCTVSASSAPDFSSRAPFSIEAWYSPDVLPQESYIVIKETRTSDGTTPIDGYGLIASATGAYVERIVGLGNAGTSPFVLPSLAFHHLVGTYDGSELAFYVDADLVAMEPDANALATNATLLQIGGYVSPPTGLVTGTIDEVAVYDYTLSLDRIALHHDIAVNGPR